MTLADFARQTKISAERTDANPNMDQDAKHPMDHWRVRLRRAGRSLTITFSMGIGHHGKPPSAYDVLSCLQSDLGCGEDFAEFCSNLGYDEDSRRAERTFRAVERQNRRVWQWLGPDLDEFTRADDDYQSSGSVSA